MPDCSYCGESFEQEADYVDHLEAVHEDELGPIDRRRINDASDGGGKIGSRAVILGFVAVIPLALLAYVLLFTGNAPDSSLPKPDTTPTAIGSVHEHGTINVTIDGQQLDFSRSKFQNYRQYDAFHFEPDGSGGEVWHLHAQRVTLKYAMWTLGIGVTESSVTYGGTTYRNGSGATVIVEVNGEPVDPAEYLLSGASAQNADQGDHVRIVVRTEQ